MYACVNVCVCVYSPASIGSLSLSLLVSNSFSESDPIHYPRRTVLNLTQGSSVTSGELIWNLVSAHSKYLCVHLLLIFHTPCRSWCKRHCWFPRKLVLVPEALKTSNLWKSLLWGSLPPSTAATWKFSSRRPLPLSISPYWACWTVETHRRWVESFLQTRSRIWWLRGQGWKRPFGPVTSIPQVSHQILYLAHHLQYHKYYSFFISFHFHIQICGGVTGWCNWFRDYFYKLTFKFSQSAGLVLRYLSTLSQFFSLHVTAVFSTP